MSQELAKLSIPFLDIKAQNASIRPELDAAVQRIIDNSAFILGAAVEQFENSFAAYCGAESCVGVNSGTAALQMALVAHDIGPGHEVITTPHSWISTSWAIHYVGAKPVFVDIDPHSFNIDPALVESAITDKTRAILPVHLYGQAADLEALRSICDRRDLLLIEDAAQAHGARIDGKTVGSIGDSACFSFYPGKNLGAFGEGGAITTNDRNVADRIRRLRDHAQDGRHHHVEVGFNARMEGLQGAVLDVKLKHLPAWTDLRRQHSQHYRDALSDVAGLELPGVSAEEQHVWHLFVVQVDDRDTFRKRLDEQGVSSGVHYPTPIPLQPAFQSLGYQPGDFPIAESVMERCVSLPMFPELTQQQLEYICHAVRSALGDP